MEEMCKEVVGPEEAGALNARALGVAEALDPEARRIIDEYVGEHPGGQEQLIPLLHRVQQDLGYLPFPVQEYVAGKLGMSPVEVHSVVSFYHFFTTTPRGRYQLKVCMGTACFVNNARTICEVLGELIDLEVGGVTEDRLFSLDQVRCIGACGLAPAMMVNDEVHGHLTLPALRKLIRKIRSKARKAGEQSGGDASHENEH